MTITLLAVSLNDNPLSQPITASFDARGGTIGRADHNTMALPDPERHISRLQAEVVVNGPRYFIKNVGAANPIVVAGRQLSAGESAPLGHHVEVRIGGYLLRVIDDVDADPSGAQIARGRAMVNDTLAGHITAPGLHLAKPQPSASPYSTPTPPRPANLSPQPLPDISSPLSSSNPFADLLGVGEVSPPARPQPGPLQKPTASTDPFADLMPPPSGLTAGSAAVRDVARPEEDLLPDDFDPFKAPAPPRTTARSSQPSDPFADLIPAAAPPSIDSMINLGLSDSPQGPLAKFTADMPAGGGARQEGGISTDPLALFGASPAPSPAFAAPPAVDRTPQIHGSFAPPRWTSADAGPSSPAPTPPVPPAPVRNVMPPAPIIPPDATWLKPRPASMAPPEPVATPAPQPDPFAFDIEPDTVVQAAPVRPVAEPAPAPVPPVAPAIAEIRSPRRDANELLIDGASVMPSHPPPVARPPVPTAVPAPSAECLQGSSPEVLWTAFCEGAGVHIQLPRGLDAEAMRTIGQLLNAAVSGTLQLIAVRASTKQELRADVTMIQQRANNPLKFSPDVQTGLEQLLNPPMRGFLPGPAAMTDAMNDLVGHSIGTMAGMRAALDGVLGRFTPSELESKLSGKSLLDSVLPMNRKARLWDLYLQHFDTIRDEAQDDFHTLFGRAFLAAYEQQLERLRQSRTPPTTP
ncbi:type VI secretion system-associated FHA domain protein TagH [Ideonella sp. A 288]|uniref:type VI secretion system-associated FHA domain protein TagH n=1 Tax=Ideonella sp. A 288 TaxID=1962181 RepID=UPI000B4A5D34|nr:type VI secretion system-associated FHA domain protein TagH [Ideonella sp. A 288]